MTEQNGTFTVTYDCNEAANADSNYGLRVAALFAILAVSTLGGILPWLCRTINLQSAFFFGTVFAGGVVLATGFVHILPDAADDLGNPCLELSTSFPWAYTFAGASLLFTFAGEFFLRLFIRARFGLSNNPQEAFKHDHDATSLAEIGGLQELEGANLKQHEAYMIDNYVAAVMLEAGIIFHSIFIGLDIGINNDPAVVRPLMIALMFHQGFEGLALGATFIRANFSTLKYLCFLLGFVLVTPIGIAIGIGVSKTYNENGKVALGFEGAFNAASAGILIYNGLADLLLPAFTSSRLLVGHTLRQLFAVFCMCAGFACMAFLAKWA